jgi:PilZ domain
MTAKNRARQLLPLPQDSAVKPRPVLAAAPQVLANPAPNRAPNRGPNRGTVPPLHLAALSSETQPRRFARVPTHAVGVLPEHREYPRATLKLPLRLRSVSNIPEDFPVTLVTRDISSTGVYFLCPRPLAMGASLEVEIVLVSKPMGYGNVVLATRAHVERSEPAAMPGWYGIAASFDDVQFDRDDRVPARFLKP